MTKYIIRDREAGNKIASFDSYEEAAKELENYESEDKRNEEYTPDFYEIVEESEETMNKMIENLAEELARYVYETMSCWSESRQKEADVSNEINDAAFGLNASREWGLSKELLYKVMEKAEKIYNDEYSDEYNGYEYNAFIN